jgi:predicted amidohydrolase
VEFDREGNCFVVSPTGGASDRVFDDVVQAVTYAESHRAHVLVLPELYLPADRLAEFQAHLAATERQSRPVITAIGLSHQRTAHAWLNEAVVLDYQGTLLWRHVKTADFVSGTGLGECLSVGGTATLRHTSAGWCMVLICLDLFAASSRAALLQAAPSLILAPSLSPSTSAHANAVEEARASGVCSVVANRPLDATGQEAPSLFACPKSGLEVFAGPTIVEWEPSG